MTDHILVPLDGSRIAELALPHAAALARLFDARITLARVPEAMVIPVASGGVWLTRIVESDEAAAHAEGYLKEVTASEVLRGLPVTSMTPEYPVAAGLLDAVAESGATLVVMTSHGNSAASRWVFGSVAQKVVRGAEVPVYVVRAPQEALDDPDAYVLPGPPQFHSIVVPLDGSPLADTALVPAARLAKASGATVHLVTIPTVPGYLKMIPETAGAIPDVLLQRSADAGAHLEAMLAVLDAEGVNATADVELLFAGDVEDRILDHATQHSADIIVLTTHGRGGIQRWLMGSTAERLIAASHVPVWIYRPGS